MIDITGKHYIAGLWVEGPNTFKSQNPHTGEDNDFAISNATVEMVDQAVSSAESAFDQFAKTTLNDRAAFLRTVADEIDARGEVLTEIGHMETALPAARLEMERGRTVNQLRFFANWIEEGSWLQARIDQADPERTPLPKPDIRSLNKAIGPVAVFGASNFPLAFSTAGGDTASALAAGCPVIVKAHPAHPGTCEIIARAFDAAIQKCAMPEGVISQLQGGGFDVGQSLVAHPGIKAVGFTGSLAGGRALFDIAVSRPEPIPFYGELGSNNPVFLLENTLAENTEPLAANWAASLTMGAGQFCTNPGVIVAVKGAKLDTFKVKAINDLKAAPAQAMLTKRIAETYQSQGVAFASSNNVDCLLEPSAFGGTLCDLAYETTPGVFAVDAQTWMTDKSLNEEIFGAAAFIVECENDEELLKVAASFHGQLTATIQMSDADSTLASQLVSIMEEKAGRVLVNGFPTGVEVCHSMVHGGPYPASTNASTTSVGSLAIQRFVRPISYQSLPDQLLPAALQNNNPLLITRLIDGSYTNRKI